MSCVDENPAMVATARARTPPGLAGTVAYAVMDAGRLGFPRGCLDLVLNRHAPVYAAEVVRVLRPACRRPDHAGREHLGGQFPAHAGCLLNRRDHRHLQPGVATEDTSAEWHPRRTRGVIGSAQGEASADRESRRHGNLALWYRG
jgi:SAM-dependent methyltransferase